MINPNAKNNEEFIPSILLLLKKNTIYIYIKRSHRQKKPEDKTERIKPKEQDRKNKTKRGRGQDRKNKAERARGQDRRNKTERAR